MHMLDPMLGELSGFKKLKKALKKHSPIARIKKVVAIHKKIAKKSPLTKIAKKHSPIQRLKKVAALHTKVFRKSPVGKLAQKGPLKKLIKLSPMALKMRLAQKLPGGKKLVRYSPLTNLRAPVPRPLRAFVPALQPPPLVHSPIAPQPAPVTDEFMEPSAPLDLEPSAPLEPMEPIIEPALEPMETFDVPAAEEPPEELPADDWAAPDAEAGAEFDPSADSGDGWNDAAEPAPWEGDMLGELSQPQQKKTSTFSPEALLTLVQGGLALRYQDKLAKLNTQRLARGDAPIDASAAALVVPAPRIQVDVGAETQAAIGAQVKKYAIPAGLGAALLFLILKNR